MILAHHAGEQLLVAAAGGASLVPLLAVAARARLRELVRLVRGRRRAPSGEDGDALAS